MPLFRVHALRHVILEADLIVDTGYDDKVDATALEEKLDALGGHGAGLVDWTVQKISHTVDDTSCTKVMPDIVIATT